MEKRFSKVLQILSTMMVLTLVLLSRLHAAYNGECWVISRGNIVRKLNADGLLDPTIIPNLTQAQAAVVNPKDGIVWIAVSAAHVVFRYDPSSQDPNQAFKQLPEIKRPHSVSINPIDGTVWIGGEDIVQKFSADGSQVLATITDVYEPEVAVNTTDGSCWVTDSRGKITRHSATGAVAAASPVQLKEPKYVAVNSKTGNAWVTDPHANVIVKLNPSGQEVLRIIDIKLPISPSVNQKDGNLWVVADSNTLVKLSADGQKLLEVPAGMAILSMCVNSQDGSVWAADQVGSTFTGAVSKFSANGQQLFEVAIPNPSFVSVGNWSGP